MLLLSTFYLLPYAFCLLLLPSDFCLLPPTFYRLRSASRPNAVCYYYPTIHT